MKNWFLIKAQSDAKAPTEISIHDYIGSWNINAKTFLDQLRNVTSKDIKLTMNSLGGSVIDGIAIYNGLREHAKKTGATITVKVLGMVASISSVIAMAGDKIEMPANTFMMVHNPSAGLQGNASEMRDMADLLDKFEGALIQTYVARTGKTAEEIKALLDKETFMTAEEAVAMGFADEVTGAIEITASFGLDNLPDNILKVYNAGKAPTKPTVEKPNEQSDSPNEVVNESKTLSAEISALAEKMGLQDHVENWLLDTTIQNKAQAQAAMVIANEIKELCVYAKVPDMTSSLIANKSTLDDARSEIFKVKAEATNGTNVDNKQPITKPPASNEQQPVINPAAIYDARKPKKKEK